MRHILKDTYYEYMTGFNKDMKDEEIAKRWFACFRYILKSFDVDFSDRSIKSLFDDWDMSNWKVLWRENTEYKNMRRAQILDAFFDECQYCCDRMSYDRLFRIHWLFRQVFWRKIKR